MGNFKLLSEIYLTFLKLGSVSFGGGYAMLSLIERDVVEKKKWVEKEKIVDIFAVSESLPGAIALNSSAFVGFSIAGVPGALCALVGNLTPSVLIMLLLSMLFTQFNDNVYVANAFNGIRPVIVGLVTFAAYRIGKTALKDIYCAIIACISFVLAICFHISVIFIILGGILSGAAIFAFRSLGKLSVQNKEGE